LTAGRLNKIVEMFFFFNSYIYSFKVYMSL